MIELLRSLRGPTWLLPLTLSLACGSPSLPGPKLVAHLTKDLLAVEYPPPPARSEIIPTRPEGNVVWLDGEWQFRGKRWRWRRGRWLEMPAGADLRFAPWTFARGIDGRLYVAEGRWVDAKGVEMESPRVVAEAPASKAIVINEEGEDENVGRDIRELGDGGPRGRARRATENDGGEP